MTDPDRRRFLVAVSATGVLLVTPPNLFPKSSSKRGGYLEVPPNVIDAVEHRGDVLSLHWAGHDAPFVHQFSDGSRIDLSDLNLRPHTIAATGGGVTIGGSRRIELGTFTSRGGDYRRLLANAGSLSDILLAQPGLDHLEAVDTDIMLTRYAPVMARSDDLVTWNVSDVNLDEAPLTGGSILAILGDGTFVAERYLDGHSPDSRDAIVTGRFDATSERVMDRVITDAPHGDVAVLARTESTVLTAHHGHSGSRLVTYPNSTTIAQLDRRLFPIAASLQADRSWIVTTIDESTWEVVELGVHEGTSTERSRSAKRSPVARTTGLRTALATSTDAIIASLQG